MSLQYWFVCNIFAGVTLLMLAKNAAEIKQTLDSKTLTHSCICVMLRCNKYIGEVRMWCLLTFASYLFCFYSLPRTVGAIICPRLNMLTKILPTIYCSLQLITASCAQMTTTTTKTTWKRQRFKKKSSFLMNITFIWGCVNKQIFWFWYEENPQNVHEQPLHPLN